MEKWTEQITPDMLPGQHRRLVELIGLDATLALCRGLGGVNYYIPKMDEVMRIARDKLIRKEYNRYNVKELALKYDLSVVSIYTIIKEAGIIPGQYTFDDYLAAEGE